MHDHLPTVVVAPMTTGSRPASFRIPITFGGKRGLVLLDQIRTLDKVRLIKKLGKTGPATLTATLATLQEIFAE
jgi:mRNA interferase MazF